MEESSVFWIGDSLKKNKIMHLRICLFCKSEFTATNHQVKNGFGIFCSKKCTINSGMKSKRPIEERFWEKVDKKSNESCWNFIGANNQGYGQLYVSKGKKIRANRLSYEIHFGKISDNLVVCHRCDNPSCVNPKHLFAGSQKDNITDMHSKNRGNTPKGSNHANAKVTEDQVIEIRKLYSEKSMRIADISRLYNASQSSIDDIVHYKTWKHV